MVVGLNTIILCKNQSMRRGLDRFVDSLFLFGGGSGSVCIFWPKKYVFYHSLVLPSANIEK